MTLFCWPCYCEELDRARRGEPPHAMPQAITVGNGRALCEAHAALAAVFEEVSAEDNSPR